ncbi:MAG: hypothetical protein IK077_15100 [Thermoguttaceae bacterium]|nr:hypothetical protein [Thermoguttaceae bacterium]
MNWRIQILACLCALLVCVSGSGSGMPTSYAAGLTYDDESYVSAPSPNSERFHEASVAIPFAEQAYDEETDEYDEEYSEESDEELVEESDEELDEELEEEEESDDDSDEDYDEDYDDGWVADETVASARAETVALAQADETVAMVHHGGVLTGGIPELEELQNQIAELQKTSEELRADLAAEQKKNEKKDPKVSDPFTMKLTGHVSMDATTIGKDDDAEDMYGNTKNSFGMRDVRFTMKGSGHGNLEYAMGIGVNDKIGFKDVYLRVKDTQYFGDVTVGHFFVESGMESVEATYDRVFASIDEGTKAFWQSRRLGVSSVHYGADQRTRAFFGVFAAPSIASSPHMIVDSDPGFILNSRFTTVPVCEVDDDGFTREVFHLGASFYWLIPGGENKLRLYTRGEMWSGDDNPYFLDGSISLADTSFSVTQAEIAYQIGEAALTAEGYMCNVYDGGGTAWGTTVVARRFLTPHCSRTYLKNSGRFGSITMPEEYVFLNCKERTVGRHWGAWEAVAKWEWTELNNLKDVPGSTYGSVNRSVMGFNWFWNAQTFMTFNWERAYVHARKGNDHADSVFDTIVSQMTFRF